MQHLIERLDLIQSAQSILRERHLLIVVAAGFGKSVLLNQFITYLPNAAYLRLTVDDNDVAVLKKRVADTAAEVLLFDDAHLLSAESDSAAWLESQLAGTTRKLVIAGRYLPFDVTLTLVQGQAVQWSEDRLRFSNEATAQLLSHDVRAADRLNGWPIAIALLRHLPADQRTPDVARDHLFSYLAKATFDRLTSDLQHFLQVCAVPEMFSAELAAHLLKSGNATTTAQITEAIQRNLFIYPAGRPGWYRFHDLIRDFLKSALPSQEHSKVAKYTIAWLREHDSLSAAIEFALSEQLYLDSVELITQFGVVTIRADAL